MIYSLSNIVYPLKKLKKNNNNENNQNNSIFGSVYNKLNEYSHIKYNSSNIFNYENEKFKTDRIKINDLYYSLNDIISKKQNQIYNIKLINYIKNKNKLLKYYTILNILNSQINQDTIISNIYKYLQKDFNEDKKTLINVHKSLEIYLKIDFSYSHTLVSKLNIEHFSIEYLIELYNIYLKEIKNS
jgi:hypothetical protein